MLAFAAVARTVDRKPHEWLARQHELDFHNSNPALYPRRQLRLVRAGVCEWPYSDNSLVLHIREVPSGTTAANVITAPMMSVALGPTDCPMIPAISAARGAPLQETKRIVALVRPRSSLGVMYWRSAIWLTPDTCAAMPLMRLATDNKKTTIHSGPAVNGIARNAHPPTS